MRRFLGLGILLNLLQLLATLYGALIVFMLVVFVPVGLIIKLPFKKFQRMAYNYWEIQSSPWQKLSTFMHMLMQFQ